MQDMRSFSGKRKGEASIERFEMVLFVELLDIKTPPFVLLPGGIFVGSRAFVLCYIPSMAEAFNYKLEISISLF